MLKPQLPRHDTDPEWAPEFANGAETSLAEQLRLHVEERSFGRTVTPRSHCGDPKKITDCIDCIRSSCIVVIAFLG